MKMLRFVSTVAVVAAASGLLFLVTRPDDEDGVVNTHSLCWSPNGEKLAFSFGGILYSTPLDDAGMTKFVNHLGLDFRGYRPSWGH